MAVNENKLTTTITIKTKTGSKDGKDVFKNYTLSKVKTTASPEDIYAVATSVGSLLAYPVASIYKQEVNEIVNA